MGKAGKWMGRGSLLLLAAVITGMTAYGWKMEQTHREIWEQIHEQQYQKAEQLLEEARNTRIFDVSELQKYCKARKEGNRGNWYLALEHLHAVSFHREPEVCQQELEAFRMEAEAKQHLREEQAAQTSEAERQREERQREAIEEQAEEHRPHSRPSCEEEDPYHADEYYSEEDFYDVWSEDFADFYDAADYYEAHNGGENA